MHVDSISYKSDNLLLQGNSAPATGNQQSQVTQQEDILHYSYTLFPGDLLLHKEANSFALSQLLCCLKTTNIFPGLKLPAFKCSSYRSMPLKLFAKLL